MSLILFLNRKFIFYLDETGSYDDDESVIIPQWLFDESSLNDSSLVIVDNLDCIIDCDRGSVNDLTFPFNRAEASKKAVPPRPVRPVEFITVSILSLFQF